MLRFSMCVGSGLAVALGACGGGASTLRPACTARPMPGLYEVVSRQCENPLHETDFCPLTQYLEIAPSEAYSISDAGYALATWFAERRDASDYSYQADALGGRCLDGEHYLIEKDGESEASFTLRDGVPVEYAFVGYTDDTHAKLRFKMRLSLQPTARTPALDQRLHIERDD